MLSVWLGAAQAQVHAGSQSPLPTATAEWPVDTFVVIAYHDVQDDLLARPDNYTVQTRELALQFEWLRGNGYHVVSLDDVIASRRNHIPLPARAVLLSFDDGLESVYSRAFPLLKAFHYPAIVGVVGSWRDPGAAGPATIAYGDENLPASDFLTAEQMREMQRSGLIEFGSHSYALHHGVLANPQGNLEPAAVSRQYDPSTKRYESEAAYATRVKDDLARNSELISQLVGVRPRVMVWPYGAYNHTSAAIAASLGMPYGLTLEEGLNTPDVPLEGMRRVLITHDVTTRDLAWALQKAIRPEPLRVMHVDLDYVYDTDAKQQEENLSMLLDRVKAMGVNTVFLQAYADPKGTGTASALYFPNRRMPMRADLFNRVAWQLRTRTGVAVYAWLPLLAFDLPASDPAHGHWVTASQADKAGDVKRLSPFDPAARQAITDIYEDLSTYTDFQGLLFSDDATLNDFEDASPSAMGVYGSWGLPTDLSKIRADPQLLANWSQHKIDYLTDFSLELARAVKRDHNDLLTARNLFARVVMDPSAAQWFGQSLPNALAHYDQVALMAMPFMEGQGAHAQRWLTELVGRVALEPKGLAKTIFELQSVDWSAHDEPIDARVLADEMTTLVRAGATNFGYYPDDFLHASPTLDVIKPVLSGKSFPGTD